MKQGPLVTAIKAYGLKVGMPLSTAGSLHHNLGRNLPGNLLWDSVQNP